MAYSFEKLFCTNIFQNIIRQLFDGEPRQVVKITVLYSTTSWMSTPKLNFFYVLLYIVGNVKWVGKNKRTDKDIGIPLWKVPKNDYIFNPYNTFTVSFSANGPHSVLARKGYLPFEPLPQRVLNDLKRTRLSSRRMIWLLPRPLPPPSSGCLSFSVFRCDAGRAGWRESGRG